MDTLQISDIEFMAVCQPGYDRPAMQQIDVIGTTGEGKQICKLEALRWAESGFDFGHPDLMVNAFDEYSSFAYGIACDLKRRRKALKQLHPSDWISAQGFIAILTIKTDECARGHRLGLDLIRYLKKLHAGMSWYVGLQAAPYELLKQDKTYRDLRSRLIGYYDSAADFGFTEVAPRSSPGLMTALWDQELPE